MQNTALLIIDMINDFQFEHGTILADKCKHNYHKMLT